MDIIRTFIMIGMLFVILKESLGVPLPAAAIKEYSQQKKLKDGPDHELINLNLVDLYKETGTKKIQPDQGNNNIIWLCPLKNKMPKTMNAIERSLNRFEDLFSVTSPIENRIINWMIVTSIMAFLVPVTAILMIPVILLTISPYYLG